MSEPVYRVNSDDLVHDTIEGEAIVLNVSNGTYYNLVGSGAVIWDLLANGCRISEVSGLLAENYGAAPQISEDVGNFVRALEKDGLVVGSPKDMPAALPKQLNGLSKEWEPPALTAFEDLQDLLTIDPIHDVDDSGWPNAKPG